MNKLKVKIDKKDVEFKGKILYHSPQYGKIKVDTIDLGRRAYVITYTYIKEFNDFYIVEIDEIQNKGIKNMSHYSSAIYVKKQYIGKECLVCLLE